MPEIHFFNPETDYALASGSDIYTPRASIIKIRRTLSLLPALFAKAGDLILSVDEIDFLNNPYLEIVEYKQLKVISPQCLSSFSDLKFRPWGWNRPLRKFLIQNGYNNSSIPTESQLDFRRNLSHRRTTIKFIEAFNNLTNGNNILPFDFYDVDEAIYFFNNNPGCIFKAPWSSSGRGIYPTATTTEVEPLRQWLRGVIRSQGSVMGEIRYKKLMDFASEWNIEYGHANFSGFSLFSTTDKCTYQYNRLLPQNEIIGLIQSQTDENIEFCVSSQQKVINKLIAPYYSGPLGVDMMIDSDRHIIPCLELNLRMTMGMTAGEIMNQIEQDSDLELIIRKLYPGNIFLPLK